MWSHLSGMTSFATGRPHRFAGRRYTKSSNNPNWKKTWQHGNVNFSIALVHPADTQIPVKNDWLAQWKTAGQQPFSFLGKGTKRTQRMGRILTNQGNWPGPAGQGWDQVFCPHWSNKCIERISNTSRLPGGTVVQWWRLYIAFWTTPRGIRRNHLQGQIFIQTFRPIWSLLPLISLVKGLNIKEWSTPRQPRELSGRKRCRLGWHMDTHVIHYSHRIIPGQIVNYFSGHNMALRLKNPYRVFPTRDHRWGGVTAAPFNSSGGCHAQVQKWIRW